jgi:non-ribosomal peptide synthetase component F
MKEEAPVEKGTDWVSGDWNRTERPFPRDRTLAVLFAEQAAATPDNLAVVSAGRQLTYEQLDLLSDRISFEIHRVHTQATGGELEPGTPVGIFLERGAETIAAIIGVLKAGAAYVPIDPDYPADRTDFIIESTGLSIVVTRRSLLGLLPERAGIETILLDRRSSPRSGALPQTPLTCSTPPVPRETRRAWPVLTAAFLT